MPEMTPVTPPNKMSKSECIKLMETQYGPPEEWTNTNPPEGIIQTLQECWDTLSHRERKNIIVMFERTMNDNKNDNKNVNKPQPETTKNESPEEIIRWSDTFLNANRGE